MSECHPGAKGRASEPGWTPVSCVVADAIRSSEFVVPARSKTDPSGQYGRPEVFTEWATRTHETPVLREHRWPGADSLAPDAFACEHYAATSHPADPARVSDPTTEETA